MDLTCFGPPPLLEPTSYPGRRPGGSFLVTADRVHPLALQLGRRLGLARIDGEDPLSVVHLDRFLFKEGEATMDERVGVLAIGSNAAPAQLAHKLAQANISRVVPVTAVTVEGLGLAFGAIVGFYGVIPAAVRRVPGGRLATWMTWLDPEQCALLDRTEPGYTRVALGGAYPVVIDGSGERLADACLYRWDGTIARLSGEVPVPEVPTDDRGAHDRGLVAGWSQVEVWSRLLEVVSPATPPPVLGASSEELRHLDEMLGLSDWLAHEGIDDGLGALAAVQDPAPYGVQHTELSGVDRAEGALVARSSSPYAAASGRPARAFCAYLAPAQASRYPGGLVEVTPAVSSVALHRRTFASIVVCDQVPPDSVGLDITLRIALGIAARDLVTLAPLTADSGGLGARLFPTRGTFARVVTSDASIAEMSSCYLSPGMMAFIGVVDGQRVVLSHPSQGRLRSVRVRAFSLPEDVKEQRTAIERPRWTSSYPRCIDLLGVQSDFSPVYLDVEDRRRLGVERCGAVHVTADWRDQVGGASRDLSLLVVVAAFGLAALGEDSVAVVGGIRVSLSILLVMLLVLATAGIVYWSVRRRLE
jgi:hypothetical protein